jgi:hypothetical protein
VVVRRQRDKERNKLMNSSLFGFYFCNFFKKRTDFYGSVMNTLTSKITTILHSRFAAIDNNIITNGRTL